MTDATTAVDEPDDPVQAALLHAGQAFDAAHPEPNGRDDMENLSDLLADLLHWSASSEREFPDYELDPDDPESAFDYALERARVHFAAEHSGDE